MAIDCIRDGVSFGVIAGTAKRTSCTRPTESSCRRREQTRAEAKKAARRLKANGGTAIGAWLTLADELFATVPGGVCHAILLTDGKDRERDGDAARPGAGARAGAVPVRLPRRRDRLGGERAAPGRHRAARQRRHHRRPGRDGRRLPRGDGGAMGKAVTATSPSACGRPRAPPSRSSGRWPRPSRT